MPKVHELFDMKLFPVFEQAISREQSDALYAARQPSDSASAGEL
jgi:hypothetical protein